MTTANGRNRFSKNKVVISIVLVVAIGSALAYTFQSLEHPSPDPRNYQSNQTIYVDPLQQTGDSACEYNQFSSSGEMLPTCIYDSVLLDNAISKLFPNGASGGNDGVANVAAIVADVHIETISGRQSSALGNPRFSEAALIIDKIQSAHVEAVHPTDDTWDL
jgi:hypothetical protein